MKNNTSSCDRQTKDLADQAQWFHKKGYNLVAISKDTCGSHKRYAKKQDINFTLVSDPDYKFAEATDSIVQKRCSATSMKPLHVRPLLLIQMVLFWGLSKK